MPLKKSCSIKAYKDNVAELIGSGRKPNQAVAIAIRTLKTACGVESDKRMSPKQIVGESLRLPRLREMASSLKSFGKLGFYNGYDNFGDVLDKFEDLRIELRPTKNDFKVIEDFKKQNESDGDKDHRDYWSGIARQCNYVTDCLRLYGLALENQVPGLDDIFQKRAIQLANRDRWINIEEL